MWWILDCYVGAWMNHRYMSCSLMWTQCKTNHTNIHRSEVFLKREEGRVYGKLVHHFGLWKCLVSIAQQLNKNKTARILHPSRESVRIDVCLWFSSMFLQMIHVKYGHMTDRTNIRKQSVKEIFKLNLWGRMWSSEACATTVTIFSSGT